MNADNEKLAASVASSAASSFLRRHWKPVVLVAAFLVTNIGSFALARYGMPEKVVVQERLEVVEVVQEVVVEHEKRVYVKDTKERIHREETKTEHPDGTTVTQKTEDINIDSHIRDIEVKEVTKEVVVEKEVTKEVFVDRTQPLPDWRVGALVGPNIPALGTGDFDPLTDLTYGLEVQRRVWGPVSASAWGLTSGQVGLGVNVEF